MERDRQKRRIGQSRPHHSFKKYLVRSAGIPVHDAKGTVKNKTDRKRCLCRTYNLGEVKENKQDK